jgi:hypothetical protein
MLHAPQGLHDFLRAYYHVKSADWPENLPHPLTSGSATELATLPTYYIMDRWVGMAATLAPDMPSKAQVAANQWLSDQDLAIYLRSFQHTGFQGGSKWFRCHTGSIGKAEIEFFSGRTTTCLPVLFREAPIGEPIESRCHRSYAKQHLYTD